MPLRYLDYRPGPNCKIGWEYLLLANIPMMHAGCEYGRTRKVRCKDERGSKPSHQITANAEVAPIITCTMLRNVTSL